ncbi:uncharacterized protein LOC110453497 [Mizuhopecten yessoensis]|uniref:uncharacterized protein LOC110453497 n=1 Tax=Mizuhopecten yessoensis TaxID=6573 RepID=UPI000B45E4F8|nr:uncharacterized protein LOC110453497 [Mizuhopecten yessoensis]
MVIFIEWYVHFRHFMSARGDKRTWQTGEVTSNKQTDGNSCGVFVLMNAEAIMEATTPLIMRQCHVGFFRKYALKKLLQSPSGAKKTSCDLPFCTNTDKSQRISQCGQCDKWAHPKCLGLPSDKMQSPSLCVFC